MMTGVVILLTLPLEHFDTILGVDMVLYCMALLLEIAAFLRLRFSKPHWDRPYKVPAEGLLLCLLYVPMAVITCAGIVLGGWKETLVAVGFLLAGLALVMLLHRARSYCPAWFSSLLPCVSHEVWYEAMP